MTLTPSTSVITFDPLLRQFHVFTNSIEDVKIYTVTVFGTNIRNIISSTSFTIEITL
jgi:virulence-associated protein VapD